MATAAIPALHRIADVYSGTDQYKEQDLGSDPEFAKLQ